MTLNISFIHIFEIITLILIIGKAVQIRRLYKQSNSRYMHTYTHTVKAPPESAAIYKKSKKSVLRKNSLPNQNSIYNRLIANYSQHNLPLPEVSFTEGLPLPEVSFSSNDEVLHVTNQRPQSKHKKILNNYIEDFFVESAPSVFHEAEIVELKRYKVDTTAEDEFITVEDEHDEFVRAFDSLEQTFA